MDRAEYTPAPSSGAAARTSTAWGSRPKIRSAEWAQAPGALDYTSEILGDVLVERLVWQRQGDKPAILIPGTHLSPGPGHIWFRFWFPRQRQVVEKYFDAQGQSLGIKIDICPAVQIEGGVWATQNLLLGIWLAPDGRLSVSNETVFEEAVAAGWLAKADAQEAEREIRRLTAGVAQGRFPPPLVRNWQIDLEQVSKSLGDRG